jgi:hypothetical protein
VGHDTWRTIPISNWLVIIVHLVGGAIIILKNDGVRQWEGLYIPNILQLENNPFMFQTTKQIIVVTYGPIPQELVTWDHHRGDLTTYILHGQRITMDHPL